MMVDRDAGAPRFGAPLILKALPRNNATIAKLINQTIRAHADH
jgi:hypothetical protein